MHKIKYLAEIDAIVHFDSSITNPNPANPPSPIFRLTEILGPPLLSAAQNAGVTTQLTEIMSAVPALRRFPSGLIKYSSDPTDNRYLVHALIVFDTNIRDWDAASKWLYDAISNLTLPSDVQIVSVTQSEGFLT